MDINQLIKVMQQKGASQIIISAGQPLRICIKDRWHKSNTVEPSASTIEQMLKKCVPSDLLNNLYNEEEFSFPHKSSEGRFEIKIKGGKLRRTVIYHRYGIFY